MERHDPLSAAAAAVIRGVITVVPPHWERVGTLDRRRPSGYEPEPGVYPDEAKREKCLLRAHFWFSSFRVLDGPVALSRAMDAR